MPDHLVDHVRLRRVQRHRRVAHVLRRQEAPFGERAVELADRGQPGGGLDAPSGEALQASGHVGELGDSIGRQGEPLHAVEERRAGVLAVQFAERLLGGGPRRVLRVGVGDRAGLLARLQSDRCPGDLVAAAEVRGIGHARMVVGELDDGSAGVVRRHASKSCRHSTDRTTMLAKFRTIGDNERRIQRNLSRHRRSRRLGPTDRRRRPGHPRRPRQRRTAVVLRAGGALPHLPLDGSRPRRAVAADRGDHRVHGDPRPGARSATGSAPSSSSRSPSTAGGRPATPSSRCRASSR